MCLKLGSRLSETMWESSDQKSEDEELAFIQDKTLEFNLKTLCLEL